MRPLLYFKTFVICHTSKGDERWSLQRAGFPLAQTTLIKMDVASVWQANEARSSPPAQGRGSDRSWNQTTRTDPYQPVSLRQLGACHSAALARSGLSIRHSLAFLSSPTAFLTSLQGFPSSGPSGAGLLPPFTLTLTHLLSLPSSNPFLQLCMTSYPKHTWVHTHTLSSVNQVICRWEWVWLIHFLISHNA